MDGVPVMRTPERTPANPVNWQTHIGMPPGARVEFIVKGPPEGQAGFWSREQSIPAPAAKTIPTAHSPRSSLPPRTGTAIHIAAGCTSRCPGHSKPGWATSPQCACGSLYFSEKLADPNDPTSAVEFYLTVDGQTPKMFDMNSDLPNIVAHQGTVEDWIIENRSNELHAFHIHQLAFPVAPVHGTRRAMRTSFATP